MQILGKKLAQEYTTRKNGTTIADTVVLQCIKCMHIFEVAYTMLRKYRVRIKTNQGMLSVHGIACPQCKTIWRTESVKPREIKSYEETIPIVSTKQNDVSSTNETLLCINANICITNDLLREIITLWSR